MAEHRCEAEDMGGRPACADIAVFQTKQFPRHYYCAFHRYNRHVWYPTRELEPIDPTIRRFYSLHDLREAEVRGLRDGFWTYKHFSGDEDAGLATLESMIKTLRTQEDYDARSVAAEDVLEAARLFVSTPLMCSCGSGVSNEARRFRENLKYWLTRYDAQQKEKASGR